MESIPQIPGLSGCELALLPNTIQRKELSRRKGPKILWIKQMQRLKILFSLHIFIGFLTIPPSALACEYPKRSREPLHAFTTSCRSSFHGKAANFVATSNFHMCYMFHMYISISIHIYIYIYICMYVSSVFLGLFLFSKNQQRNGKKGKT